MKTIKADGTPENQPTEEGLYTTTLSDGRRVTMRPMLASDLLFMERSLSKVGDIERGIALASRLSVPPSKITPPEIQKLSIKDFKKVSELAGKAGGLDDEDEEDEGDFVAGDDDFL